MKLKFSLKESAEEYATRLVDGMDLDTLVEIAITYLMEDYKTYTTEELIGEIQEHGMYDDLLEEDETPEGLESLIDNLQPIDTHTQEKK
jgi:hypothetical protein